MPTLALPSTPGAAGDAARRLARWIGTGITAKDGSSAAALLLGIGAALADTAARADQALLEVLGDTADETLPLWESSLGMVSGEGDTTSNRQAAVTARWRALNGGPSPQALRRSLSALAAELVLVEILVADILFTDPLAVYRLALLVSDAHEASAPLRAQLSAALAPQAQAHVTWSIGRGDGPDIDAFRCDDPASLVERDLLAL